MTHLQPYSRLDMFVIDDLISRRTCYLVAQTYRRAAKEIGIFQTPVLLTAYVHFDEALLHHTILIEKSDALGTIYDLSKAAHFASVAKLCTIDNNEVGFFSRIEDWANANRTLQSLYHSRIQVWIAREKSKWGVTEQHIPEPSLEILMGEPVVKIKYGNRFVVATLDELDAL